MAKYKINEPIEMDIFLRDILTSDIEDSLKISAFIKRYLSLNRQKRKLLHAAGLLKISDVSKVRKKKSSKEVFNFNPSLGESEDRHALALTPGDIFYKSLKWKNFRFRCFKELERKCVICGSNEKLHLDHIKPRSIYPELAFEKKNMQILCEQCNLGKGATTFDAKKIIIRKNKLA